MTLYMLHTDVAKELIQGRSPALDRRIASELPQKLCISAVTRGELLCGTSMTAPQHRGRKSKSEESDLADTIARSPQSPVDQTSVEALRKNVHTELASAPHLAKLLRGRLAIDMGVPTLTEQTYLSSRVLDEFMIRVQCLPWDAEAATYFAKVAVDLYSSGSPLGSLDLMIVAHAIALEAVLVTNNERHFAHVSELKTDNWTRS
jgi:predicted nucleic acid-binding protein